MIIFEKRSDRRIFAGIMGLLMLFLVLLSAFYLAAEAGHDCCGEGCCVCACMEECASILRSSGRSFVIAAAVFISFLAWVVIDGPAACDTPQPTLVSLKIRLNN